jgi:hypothetical protein
VIDNNTFSNLRYPLGLGQSRTRGKRHGRLILTWFGVRATIIYAEDNTFTSIRRVLYDADQGGRYVSDITPLHLGQTLIRYLTFMVERHYGVQWGLRFMEIK